MSCSFFVPGIPAGQGNKSAVPQMNRRTGKPILDRRGRPKVVMLEGKTDEARRRFHNWRSDVKAFAASAWGREPCAGPVSVQLEFVMPRPKAHFRTGRNAHLLKLSAPEYCTTSPDIDKLIRAVLDSLTAVVYADDRQVVVLEASQLYDSSPGVHLTAAEL